MLNYILQRVINGSRTIYKLTLKKHNNYNKLPAYNSAKKLYKELY